MKRTVLSIAGSDSSGGAGIQADIKTIEAYHVYAMSAITAITAQNTLGVQAVYGMGADCVIAQLASVFEDIYPDAVKIGMLGSREVVHAVAEYLKDAGAKHIVLDPVMLSSSGTALLEKDAEETLKRELLPLAEVLTPNIPEAERLCGYPLADKAAVEEAAMQLSSEYHCAVALKGGHAKGDADDLLCLGGARIWIQGRRIHNPDTHGTGCTFSSAIAAGLALGRGIEQSVRDAKQYMEKAIAAGLRLGKGHGPLEHSVRTSPS